MNDEPIVLTADRLAELQEIVEAASPDPWNFAKGEQACGVDGPEGSITWDDHGGEVFTEADARHIAAFDRPTALALLRRLKELQAQVSGGLSAWDLAIDRAEAAEAKVAAARKLHDPSDWHPDGEVCAGCLDAEAIRTICEPLEKPPETSTAEIVDGHSSPPTRVKHAGGCSGRLKSRWSGMSCDCGARWECF